MVFFTRYIQLIFSSCLYDQAQKFDVVITFINISKTLIRILLYYICYPVQLLFLGFRVRTISDPLIQQFGKSG
jgi:hypothetical protein